MRFRLTLLLTTGMLALFARDAGAWPPGGVRFERPDPSNGIMGFGPDGQGGTYAAWPAADAAGVIAFRIHRLDANGNTPAVRVWYSAGGHASGAIGLFDLAGRRLASARVTASSGEITLSGTRSLANGVFLVRLTAGAHSAVAKLVALR
jgi:hypothetical protein